MSDLDVGGKSSTVACGRAALLHWPGCMVIGVEQGDIQLRISPTYAKDGSGHRMPWIQCQSLLEAQTVSHDVFPMQRLVTNVADTNATALAQLLLSRAWGGLRGRVKEGVEG